ncbi:amiB activator [bacterium BMS3Abin15]|nr:amiB activator [bacterium BMS3Abin15]
MILGRKPVILLLAVLFTAFCAFSFSALAQESTEEPEIDQGAVDDTEEDIEGLEKKLEREEGIKARYEGDLSRTQGAINATQYEINKTDALIEETEETISRKEQEVVDLNKRIEVQKEILSRLMQEMYYGTKEPLFNITIKQNGFSQMLGGEDYILTLENKINSVIGDIKDSKKNIKEDKEELEGEKDKHEGFLSVKQVQQQALLNEKAVTQSKIAKKEVTISEFNSKLSKLRSILSGFLGESYDASDIVDAVKFASKKTGVSKGFLMAMLDKESDLGRFTGACTYKNTRVKDSDKEEFKKICKELDYDYKKKKISCALSSGGYGGAMGVAQFMPTTWAWGSYPSQISAITGHNPADPWNLMDGVVGMALKLERAGGDKKSGERSAAMIYYCGSDHPAETYPGRIASCNNYADTVISWSDGYDDFF